MQIGEGSIPPHQIDREAPFRSVTDYSQDRGNTLATNGFGVHSMRPRSAQIVVRKAHQPDALTDFAHADLLMSETPN